MLQDRTDRRTQQRIHRTALANARTLQRLSHCGFAGLGFGKNLWNKAVALNKAICDGSDGMDDMEKEVALMSVGSSISILDSWVRLHEMDRDDDTDNNEGRKNRKNRPDKKKTNKACRGAINEVNEKIGRVRNHRYEMIRLFDALENDDDLAEGDDLDRSRNNRMSYVGEIKNDRTMEVSESNEGPDHLDANDATEASVGVRNNRRCHQNNGEYADDEHVGEEQQENDSKPGDNDGDNNDDEEDEDDEDYEYEPADGIFVDQEEDEDDVELDQDDNCRDIVYGECYR